MILLQTSKDILVGALKSRTQTAFAFLLNLAVLIPRVHLDPDATHDGIIYPAALVVSNGGVPNRDVFSQYGPGTHLLHGFWLKITENSLISLRYFTALVLATSFTFAYVILKSYLGRLVSMFLILTLSLSAPLFLPSLLPWPSVLTTCITMLTLSLLLNLNLRQNTKWAKIYVALVFSMTSFAVLIRIHLVVNLILLISLFTYFCLSRRIEGSYLSWAFFGIASSFLLIILYFMASNSWGDYVYQSLSFPFKSFGEKDGFFTFRQLILYLANLLIYSIAIFVFSILLLIWKKSSSRKKSLLYGVVLTIFFALILFVSRIDAEVSSFKNPLYLLVYSCTYVLQSVNLLTAVFSLYILIGSLLRIRTLGWNKSLTLVIGFAVLLQLYPGPDPLHLWWISPVLITVIVVQIEGKKVIEVLRARTFSVVSLLSAFLVVLLCQQLLILSDPRVPYLSKPLLGMRGESSIVASVDETMQLLEINKRKYDIEYRCGEGIFSVAGNYFDTKNPYFLDILSSPKSLNSTHSAVFLCGVGQSISETYSNDSSWHVVFRVRGEDGRSNMLLTRFQ
jgi:hypothetical protein